MAKLKIIQIVLWIGVAADAAWALALVWPPMYSILTARPLIDPELNLRLVMGIGACLMAGWTVLLIWTSRKPVERRGVMLITAAVVAGLFIVTLISVLNKFATPLLLVKGVVLEMAFVYAYYQACTVINLRS